MVFLRKKRNYLKQMYRQNPESGAYLIEVSLESYQEVFNGWDPSPFRRRDIEPELLDFIYHCSEDIPLRQPVELCFYMPKDQYDEQKEQLTKVGFTNNLNFIASKIRKELKSSHRKIFLYVLMSLIFLLMAYFLRSQSFENLFTTILTEGMFIGGWVFLWEAFSLFFFTDQEHKRKLKLIQRLLDYPIVFIYQ